MKYQCINGFVSLIHRKITSTRCVKVTSSYIQEKQQVEKCTYGAESIALLNSEFVEELGLFFLGTELQTMPSFNIVF